jgi:hypothetical protein
MVNTQVPTHIPTEREDNENDPIILPDRETGEIQLKRPQAFDDVNEVLEQAE